MKNKIAIIGAGISGLSCAYFLCNKGYDVTIIAKEFSPNITSNKAAAFWFPYHIRNDKRGVEWSQKSYAFYKQLCNDASSGISMKKLIKVLRKNIVEEESTWLDFIPENACRLLPAEELKENVAKGYEVLVPLIETQLFLPFLQQYVKEKNVAFKQDEIENLYLIANENDVVINCTGLGARILCNDHEIIPVRGQVALLETDTSLPIYLDNEMPLYVVPRKDAMIVGGTYEENIFEAITEPANIDIILENAYNVFPEFKQRKIIGNWAGLRPYRTSVRVEQEDNIIHNYGHGGSGFTLAFGCAETVMKMVEEIIKQ